MRNLPHSVIRAAWLLAVGASLTFLVGWLCHQEQPRAGTTTSPRPPPWPRGVPGNWPRPSHFTQTHYTWGEVRQWSGGTRLSYYRATEHRAGFPWRALARREWASEIQPEPEVDPISGLEEDLERALERIRASRTEPPTPVRVAAAHGAMVLGGGGGGRAPPSLVLPVAPLWPGFALNTLLYAGLVLAALSVRRAWVRERRRDGGLCLGCGYPPAALTTCPECGQPVIALTPLPRWRRRAATVGAAIATTLLAVYAASMAGGICYKQETRSGGWYAGIWRGHCGVARTQRFFYAPGWEVSRYDIPFRFDAAASRSPERTEVLVPLWMPLGVVVLATLGVRGILVLPGRRRAG